MNRNSIQLKNILSLSALKAIGLGLNFILVPLLLSIFGKTDYGIWITVFSIVNWIFTFDLGLGLGLRNKLTESLTLEDYNRSNSLISTTYITIILVAIIILLIGVTIIGIVNFKELLNYNKVDSLQTFLFVSLSFTLINFILSVYKNLYLSVHKSFIPELVNTLFLFSFVLIVLFYKNYNISQSMTVMMFWFGFLNLIISIAATIHFFKTSLNLKLSLKLFSRSLIKELLQIGGGFFIIQFSILIIFTTDNVIISHLLGPEMVTDYSVIQKLFQIFIVIFGLVLTPSWSLYIHAISKNDIQWIKSNIKSMLKLFLILFVAGLILLFNIDFIVDFWVGPIIKPPKYLATVFFIFTMIFSFSNVFMYFINATGKLKLQTKLYIFGAIANIPLSIIFVKILGNSTGVIIATICSIIPLLIFMPLQAYKILKSLTLKTSSEINNI